MQTRKGQEIEDESMQIIESEIGSHTFNEMEWPIVRRIIHSTADFDFARENKLLFHKDAISNGINAMSQMGWTAGTLQLLHPSNLLHAGHHHLSTASLKFTIRTLNLGLRALQPSLQLYIL